MRDNELYVHGHIHTQIIVSSVIFLCIVPNVAYFSGLSISLVPNVACFSGLSISLIPNVACFSGLSMLDFLFSFLQCLFQLTRNLLVYLDKQTASIQRLE